MASINFAKNIDGKCVVNTTPHALNFLNKEGETVVVPSSVPEGEAILDQIEEWAREEGIKHLRVIGSIIAAQAYPGRVLGMCPAPGFERVPPAEKRMTAEKFTVYTK